MLEPARQVACAVLSNVGPMLDPCHYGRRSAFHSRVSPGLPAQEAETTQSRRLQGLLMPTFTLTTLLVRCLPVWLCAADAATSAAAGHPRPPARGCWRRPSHCSRDGQALTRKVIHYRQQPDPAPVEELISHEVHEPTLSNLGGHQPLHVLRYVLAVGS